MKVLAVEDDPVAGLLLTRTLRELGCEVELAVDGGEAWRRLERETYRLVVCDWLMPQMDGLELCRRIRAKSGEYVYFILVTNAASDENETSAIEQGVDDFLSKPITPRELRNRVRVAQRILSTTARLNQLQSFLPICGYCRKVRDDQDYWRRLESYIAERTGASFSHGICPDCYHRHVEPQLRQLELDGLTPPEDSE